jgi:CubicO group peptidase (beta-lactamase class C family)
MKRWMSAEIMQELVLGPAGMTHSTYQQPLSPAADQSAARAHDKDGKFEGRVATAENWDSLDKPVPR